MLLPALHMVQLLLTDAEKRIIITSNVEMITVCAHVTAASDWAKKKSNKEIVTACELNCL